MAAPLAVVVGIDGSPSSLRAVRYAARLAREGACTLHMCNVQPALTYAGMLLATPATVAEHLSGAPGDDAMAEARELLEGAGLHAEWEVLHGEPAAQIAAYARKAAADLVLVGHRGMNPVKELLVGSVARRVCELAPCPVIVAR